MEELEKVVAEMIRNQQIEIDSQRKTIQRFFIDTYRLKSHFKIDIEGTEIIFTDNAEYYSTFKIKESNPDFELFVRFFHFESEVNEARKKIEELKETIAEAAEKAKEGKEHNG